MEISEYSEDNFRSHLSEDQEILWKMADYLDGWTTIQQEKELGNKNEDVIDCGNTYMRVIEKLINFIHPESNIYGKVSHYVADYVGCFNGN